MGDDERRVNMLWGVQQELDGGDDEFDANTYVVTVHYRVTFRSRSGVYSYVKEAVAQVEAEEHGTTRAELGDAAVQESGVDEEYNWDSPPEIEVLHVEVVVAGDGGLFGMPMFGKREVLDAAAAANTHTLQELGFKKYTPPVVSPFKIEYAENADIDHHISGTQCVTDYMLWEAAKTDSRKGHWTRSFLNYKLGERPNVKRIIEFAKEEEDVSVFAVDITLRVFAEHRPVNRKSRVYLIFMVKENHCLPITNAKWRSYLTRANEVPMEAFKFTDADAKTAVVYEEGLSDEEMASALNLHVDSTAVIIPTASLDDVCALVMKETGKIVCATSWAHGNLVMFRHPVNGALVVAGPDYKERKAFCSTFYDRHVTEDFKGGPSEFTNQSWGVIGAEVLRANHLLLPKSEYSPEYKSILTQYPMSAYRARVHKSSKTLPGDISLDIRRCYSYLLKTADTDFPVFGPMDYVRIVTDEDRDVRKAGEYYVNRMFHLGGGTIQLSRGWYPAVLVRYALENLYIFREDITYFIPSTFSLPASSFATFCDEVETVYTDSSKKIINMFVGCLGSLYSRESRCGFTNDVQTAASTLSLIQTRGNVGRINCCGGVYMVQETTKKQKAKGSMPIYRAILGGSYMMLDKVIRFASIPPEKILAFNTDSIKLRDMPVVEGASPSKDESKWGEYYIEQGPVILHGRPLDELPLRSAYIQERPVIDHFFELDSTSEPATGHPDEVDVLNRANELSALNGGGTLNNCSWIDKLPTGASIATERKGALFLGPPGCGKTYLMAEVYHALLGEVPEESIAVTAYTHAACANLRAKGLPARVFNSLVWNSKAESMDVTNLKDFRYLFIDEFTMLPPSEMRVLLDASFLYGFTVWAAGDNNQCCAPVTNPIAYHVNPNFLNMCGNRLYHMAYKPETGRYDETLKGALEYFLVSKTIGAWQAEPEFDGVCFTNICFTNAKRNMLNKSCLELWLTKYDHGPKVTIKSTGRSMIVCTNLDVMAYHGHILEFDILKTQTWKITSIDQLENKITLEMEGRDDAVELSWAQFMNVFDYSFAVTVHKIQGLTYHSHYVIHEANHNGMSFNVLFTALSRGTTLSNVHIKDVNDWGREYASQKTDFLTQLKAEDLIPVKISVYIYSIPVSVNGSEAHDKAVGCATGDASNVQLDAINREAGFALQELLGTMDITTIRDGLEVVRRFTIPKAALLIPAYYNWLEALKRTEPDVIDIHYHAPEETGEEEPLEPAKEGAGQKRKRDKSETTDEVTNKKKRKEKFAVKQYESSCYFSVRNESKAINKEDRIKNFKYKPGDGNSQAIALEAATKWSAAMKSKYC